jgi:tRNA(adenine34) deaminase
MNAETPSRARSSTQNVDLDHEALMDEALVQARLAADAGEVPIGALLLDATGAVISSGFNQPI